MNFKLLTMSILALEIRSMLTFNIFSQQNNFQLSFAKKIIIKFCIFKLCFQLLSIILTLKTVGPQVNFHFLSGGKLQVGKLTFKKVNFTALGELFSPYGACVRSGLYLEYHHFPSLMVGSERSKFL